MKTINNNFLALVIVCMFAAAAHAQTDTAPPLLYLKTPVIGARTNDATISGYCTEANLAHVWYQFFNTNDAVVTASDMADVAVTGTMVPDATVSKKWNFSTAVTPLPGTNTLWVQAEDAGGRLSPPVMRRIFYQVGTPFTLNIEGDGGGKVTLGLKLTSAGGYRSLLTLTANGSGATLTTNLNIGEDYVLIATYGRLSWFSNWTGVVTTTSNKIFFRGAEGLSAAAHFDTNRFWATYARPFNGLFREADAVRMESAGSLRLTHGSLGTYSALLRLNGQTTSFTGTFSHSGFASNTVTRDKIDRETGETSSETLSINLQLDFTNAVPIQCWATISSSAGWTSTFDVWKCATSLACPNTRFNIVIPPGDGAPVDSPGGYGFIRFNPPYQPGAVPENYYVMQDHLTLSDGTIDVTPYPLTPNGSVLIYRPLYNNSTGLLWGSIDLAANPPSGQLTWIKKRPPSGQYPHGFTNNVTAFGSTFVSGSTITLTSDPAILTFKDGGLTEPLDFQVSKFLAPGAKLVKAPGAPINFLDVWLNETYGTMGGFFADSTAVNSPRRSIRGIFLQNDNTAYGYWVGKNGLSGAVYLHYP